MSILALIKSDLNICEIAAFLMPDIDPGIFIIIIMLGVAGMFLGRYLGRALGLFRRPGRRQGRRF